VAANRVLLLVDVLPLPAPLFSLPDTATTAIYTLSLHDALPIWGSGSRRTRRRCRRPRTGRPRTPTGRGRCRRGPRRTCRAPRRRSEEHTSELQSRENLVCRLLLEKKKKKLR